MPSCIRNTARLPDTHVASSEPSSQGSTKERGSPGCSPLTVCGELPIANWVALGAQPP